MEVAIVIVAPLKYSLELYTDASDKVLAIDKFVPPISSPFFQGTVHHNLRRMDYSRPT